MRTVRLTLRLLPLLFVVFVDSIGYTIVVPVLADAFLSDAPILMPHSSLAARSVIYGLALGIFELMAVYMAPVLGELSDSKGRRLVLLACLTGYVVSFGFIVAAILAGLVWLLLLGRVLGGATAGSLPVAQAAAVDISGEEDRPLALSLSLLASSLGFVVGPIVGGLSSWNESTPSSADLAIPIAVAALLGLFAMAVLLIGHRPPRTDQPGKGRINLGTGLRGFRAAFADAAIRRLIVVVAMLQLGWSAYFLFLPSILYERYDINTGVMSLVLGLFGAGFCLAYGVLLPLLSKRFSAKWLARWGLWVALLLMLISVLWPSMTVQWVVTVPVATAVSIGYGAIVTQFSDAVDSESQGWILGVSVSVYAMAWGVSSIVAGFLSSLHYLAPFYFALASVLLSALLSTAPGLRALSGTPRPRGKDARCPTSASAAEAARGSDPAGQ